MEVLVNSNFKIKPEFLQLPKCFLNKTEFMTLLHELKLCWWPHLQTFLMCSSCPCEGGHWSLKSTWRSPSGATDWQLQGFLMDRRLCSWFTVRSTPGVLCLPGNNGWRYTMWVVRDQVFTSGSPKLPLQGQGTRVEPREGQMSFNIYLLTAAVTDAAATSEQKLRCCVIKQKIICKCFDHIWFMWSIENTSALKTKTWNICRRNSGYL